MDAIKLPRKGRQINFDHKKSGNPDTFEINGKYYRGRIEEAKRYYSRHPEVNNQYTFEEYIDLTYSDIKKPTEAIKQEIIDICIKSMEIKDIANILFLLNKL
jgi:hypothetical protein